MPLSVKRFVSLGILARLVCVAVSILVYDLATAQVDTATLSGHVVDLSRASIGEATVDLIDTEHGTKTRTRTDRTGAYIFPHVAPGYYLLRVSAPSFKTADVTNLSVSTQDDFQQNVRLERGRESESVSLVASDTPIENSRTVSTLIDRKLVTELPLNGRSFQTLFQLTPGVVITPTSFGSQGQFSVNGQRTNTNYFLVDGVSANFGISVAANPGQSAGGSLPALTALGGTNSLVSTNDVQEFAILTSSFAAEFGRTPGGQISIVTRSGTNDLHGGLFDYLRNDAFDANDWFANQHNLRRQPLRQNDFGGVLGGPIRKDKSFFFLSYEGLRLRQPAIGQSDVPSLAARQAASPSMKPFFNAYPLPNGPDEGNGLAQAEYAFSNPSRLDAVSLRVDRHFGERLAIFGRYNVSTSNQKLRGASVTSLSSVTALKFALQTLTLGSTWQIAPHSTNDTRLNWSKTSAIFDVAIDGFGGANPVATAPMLPTPFNEQNSLFQLFLALSARHSDLAIGRNVANFQSQINLIDSFTWDLHEHSFKAGLDLRRVLPETEPAGYLQETLFNDVAAALTGAASASIVQASTSVHSSFLNVSLFIQDTWRPTTRLTLTCGVRWDFNPTPTGQGNNGLVPFAILGISNLPMLSLASPGTRLYRTTAVNFAPRFGLAYKLGSSPKMGSVIRAGVGTFYDFANGPAGNAYSGFSFPFSAIKVLSGAPFPLSPSDAAPPSITTHPPFDTVVAFPAVLKLPYNYHWNVSIEQSLGAAQTLTFGYVGSAGHSLLRTVEYFGGESGVPLSFGELLFTNNSGYSNYNALQVQLRRRVSLGLDLVASYTLSHSLDNASTDTTFSIPENFLDRRADYGPSDFDIRHSATIGIDYDLPTLGHTAIVKGLISGWAIDPIFAFRSSPPVNVVLSRQTATGIPFRPDLIPGVPLYIKDSSAPGRVRINPAAFSVPITQQQGNFGRNRVRGFSLFQIDLALRRNLQVTRKMAVQVRIEAFNLFNHPNFAPESGQLGVVGSTGTFVAQPGFGISANMLGNSFQTGGPGSGFSPLYQIGQARSLQAALKLQF